MTYRAVTLVVLEGKDLAPVDNKSADPYVHVSIGGDRKLTAETPSLVRDNNAPTAQRQQLELCNNASNESQRKSEVVR
jgi:hypothetical protein